MTITDKITDVKELTTWHQNGPYPVDLLYKTRQTGTKDYNTHNETVLEIQKLLAECKAEGQRFRAYGSRWSLNDIAFNNARLHDNNSMKLRLEINPNEVHPESPLTNEQLVFVQCGTKINQLTNWLEKRGRSLRTSGGSNGQSIAGVISTGVHGGAMKRQGMSDYVKGMHLIIGPDPKDRVYLERSSQKIMKDDYASTLNSRLIRDDDLFNAALVGLGSFGFIAAVVLEVQKIFYLKRYIRKIKYDEAIHLLKTLDFKGSTFRIKEETDDNGDPITPYHFKPYINQYTKKCIAEVLYETNEPPTKPVDFEIEKQLHPDLFRLMQWALDKSNGKIVKLMTKILQNEVFPNPKKEYKPVVGSLGDIFHSVPFQQPGFSWAIGVDHRQIDKAMEVFIDIFDEIKVPGLTAIKLVQQTDSTLGFTKFPLTAVIGLDGLQWPDHVTPWKQTDVEREIIRAFSLNNIPFTLHWGKNAAWEYPRLVDMMYGDKDDEWRKQRSRLLDPLMADIFSNDFLRRVGLAGYERNVHIIT